MNETAPTANGTAVRPAWQTFKPVVGPATTPAPVGPGPVLAWPPATRQEDDLSLRRAVLRWMRQRKAPDPDTTIARLTGSVVLFVAAIAAVVSYSHIYDLAVRHGQSGTAARLLPLSVDGLIAEASLVLLYGARNKLPRHWLAVAMLTLGVAATVAANVAYGIPARWLDGVVVAAVIGGVVSAWPAVAFIGSVEMAVKFVRDTRAVATKRALDDDTDHDTEDDTDRQDEQQGPRPRGR